MPTLAAPPPPSAAEIRPLLRGVDDVFLAQGVEGRKLGKHIIGMFAQLQASESLRSVSIEDDVPDYKPMPAKRVATMRVKFRFIGRGQPMPYSLDDVVE